MLTKIIIIEDNQNAREIMTHFLASKSNTKLVGMASNCERGVALIKKAKPDVVLLDIEMPDGSGFDIFSHFDKPFFKTIIITGYNDYAIKALKLSAVDYLLKPVSKQELWDAIDKASKLLEDDFAHYDVLKKYLAISPDIDRLVIPSDSNKQSLLFSDIVYLKSDGGYTIFYTKDHRHVLTSRPISYFEEILPQNFFFRTHKSFIVNFSHIRVLPAGRGGTIEFQDDFTAQLSVRKAAAFRKWYTDKTLASKT